MTDPGPPREGHAFRRRAAAVGRDLHRLSRLVRTRPEVLYVGFPGRGNVGDDALFDANRLLLGQDRLPVAPVSGPVLDLGVRAFARRSPAPTTLLLGGGTVVGRTDWRERLHHLRRLLPGSQVHVSGAGVEEPDFSGAGRYAESDELLAWADLLGDSRAGVRGPRSARLLQQVGVDAVVVGDPVLALGPESPSAGVEEDLVGVNVAWPEDVYGGDRRAVVRDLATAIRSLLERGFRVRLLPMEAADEAVARGLMADLPGRLASRAHAHALPRSYAELSSLVADCSVVVGQRLHTTIAAHAAFVPGLSVAYRPKCFDHLEAVDRLEWGMSSDALDPVELVRQVESVQANRDREVEHLTQRVRALRQRLWASAGDLSRAVS